MTVESVVRDYYEALRRGEPLYPYFREDEATTKVGVSELLVGYDEVAETLREQTRTTEEWSVESRRLETSERDDHAVFADEVELAWTDRDAGDRRRFETRWTGTLEPDEGEWLFVSMHVSAPRDLRR